MRHDASQTATPRERKRGRIRDGLPLWLAAILSTAVFLGLSTFSVLQYASAHGSGHTCTFTNHCTPTGNAGFFLVDGDRFDKYDTNWDITCCDFHNNNVDWPTNLIFYENADVPWVKYAIDYWNSADVSITGSTKAMYIKETDKYKPGLLVPGEWKDWDLDGGRKQHPAGLCGGFIQATHYRLYADESQWSYDQLYNDVWGFYVVGTSHIDQNDGCPDAEFGWNNAAEHRTFLWADNVPTWWGVENYLNLSNKENARDDNGGSHHWLNNNGNCGCATAIYVP